LLCYISVLGLSWSQQSEVFNWYWKLAILFFASVLFLVAIIHSLAYEKLNKHFLEKDNEIQKLKLKLQSQDKQVEQLLHSNKARSRFLAHMSHEIKNPLNSILGFSELLSKRKLDEEALQFVGMIAQSGEGILGLLNDILDLNKIDEGKIRLEAISFYFKEVISSTILPYEYLAKQKNLQFELIFDPQIPDMVIADPYRFRQILFNLIGNSIKFTKQGKISIQFSMQGIREGKVCIRTLVSDTGVGVSASRLDSIFNPFIQSELSTTREFGGSGLGLAIVSELVKLMKGEVFIESPNPQQSEISADPGTQIYFDIEFPIDKKQAPVNSLPSVKGKKEVKLSQPLHILVAEDNADSQVLFQTLLEGMGATIDIVNNGKEALNVLRKNKKYDLILLDIQMPLMDGLTASRCIRSELKLSIPIIGATSNPFKEDIREALQAGMNDYLPKPFRQEELYKKIRRWGTRKHANVQASADPSRW